MLASIHWYDWAGLVGVALTLLAYLLLQAGRARGDALPYQLMNAFRTALAVGTRSARLLIVFGPGKRCQ